MVVYGSVQSIYMILVDGTGTLEVLRVTTMGRNEWAECSANHARPIKALDWSCKLTVCVHQQVSVMLHIPWQVGVHVT